MTDTIAATIRELKQDIAKRQDVLTKLEAIRGEDQPRLVPNQPKPIRKWTQASRRKLSRALKAKWADGTRH